MAAVAVVGNPRTPSRTRVATEFLLEAVGGGRIVDLAEPGRNDGLVDARPGPGLQEALAWVAEADVVVFASPTYKAAYTGMLKCFLDLLPPNALAGKLVLPLMLGGGEGHRLTVEHTLKPVLGELGGTCPPRGLYLLDSEIQVDPPGLGSRQRAAMDEFLAACPRAAGTTARGPAAP